MEVVLNKGCGGFPADKMNYPEISQQSQERKETKKMEKVYLVNERFTEDCERTPEQHDTYVIGAYRTADSAIKAVKERRDEIIEEIIDGDENEMSRISADKTYGDNTINICATIENDSCAQWELAIKVMPLN